MTYKVKLEHFEGPLELLLSLIEQERLDVTRLSLAQVTDQYLEYIEQKELISLENLSAFLSVAAKLILIKSKALLPLLEYTEEEEAEIKDLEKQLAHYKKFKDAAKKLSGLFGGREVIFTRDATTFEMPVFSHPQNVDALRLAKVFKNVIGSIEKVSPLEEEMIREVIALEEKILHIQRFVSSRAEASFSQVVAEAKDKIEVVVSFLAMLEMVKQRVILAAQDELFGDIKFKKSQEEDAK